jgi:soluble lytic murein transglycosylase
VVKRWWLWLLAGLLLIDGIIFFWWYTQKQENRHNWRILAAARRYGVDPALIKAVVWQESRFDASARGKAGEIGLMQIRELAALEWAEAEKIHPFSHEHLLDPKTNVLAGTWYLGKLLRRYEDTDNPLPYALADYNAGRRNVLRWNDGKAETDSSPAFLQEDSDADVDLMTGEGSE